MAFVDKSIIAPRSAAVTVGRVRGEIKPPDSDAQPVRDGDWRDAVRTAAATPDDATAKLIEDGDKYVSDAIREGGRW